MLDCFMSQNGPLPSSTYANLTFIQSSRKRLSQATFHRFHLTVVGTPPIGRPRKDPTQDRFRDSDQQSPFVRKPLSRTCHTRNIRRSNRRLARLTTSMLPRAPMPRTCCKYLRLVFCTWDKGGARRLQALSINSSRTDVNSLDAKGTSLPLRLLG